MIRQVSIEVLVLSGGRAKRLEMHRKRIDEVDFPMLKEYHDAEGPKGLAILTIADKRMPLIDLHLMSYWQEATISKITLGLGFAGQMIEQYYAACNLPKPLHFVREVRPAGTIAALLKMYQSNTLPQGMLLLANGDNILEMQLDAVVAKAESLIAQKGLDQEECVVDILTLVPWQESAAYGVVDFNPANGCISAFLEKSVIEANPYILVNGEKFCYINSGFSLMMNARRFVQKYVETETFMLVEQLEAGSVEYASNESKVKYESIYSKVAKSGHLLGVVASGFWADSGNEAQIKIIEAHYARIR
jgi:NDP-sugar pyrophosphorylase family protein